MGETMPRLFTALAEWGACMLYLTQYRRRFRGPRLWLVAGGSLILQGAWLQVTGSAPVALWMPAMAAAVGLMLLLIWSCAAVDLIGAGYCTVRAFLLAEFAASLEWQLYTFFVERTGLRGAAVSGAFLAAVYGGVFLLALRLEQRANGSGGPPGVTNRELLSASAMGLGAFLLSNLSFVSANTPFSSSFQQEISTIRTLVDLSGVVLLYAYHLQLSELHTRRELDAIKNILQNQYIQYRQSRESIDLINRKYHDLKHQIAVLRAEEDPDRRAAFLDRMEEEILHYEAQNKTGNSVLDTVLTGKSLYCAKHRIKLTCVADGSHLAFMDIMDVCTLFGNALDNAIEYELSIPDKEKRLIHLEVYVRKGFLVIRCENYCPNPPVFENGLPVTTKADREYHGYGLKSIRYTAEKYGGSMAVEASDGWFQLTLLFPLQPDQPPKKSA